MKNNKNGQVVLIILLVLILGVLIALTIAISAMAKINKDTINNQDKVQENVSAGNNDQTNSKDEVDNSGNASDDEKKEEETVDPYANYKKITWSTKKQTLKGGVTIEVDGTSVKVTCDNKNSKHDFEEPIKSVCTWLNGGIPVFYVLTESGYVHELITDDVYYMIEGTRIVKDLAKYKIIDMTTKAGGVIDVPVYFLTESGKLVNSEGITYETLNRDFAGVLTLDKGHQIPYDPNGYGYHWDDKNNKYVEIVSKSTGAKLSMSKLFLVDDGVVIVTAYNKVFLYDGESSKAKQITGDVKAIERKENDRTNSLVIRFTNNNNSVFENVSKGYDFKNKKEINISKLDKFSPYKGYDEIVWCGRESKLYSNFVLWANENSSAVILQWQGLDGVLNGISTHILSETIKSVCAWMNGGIPVFTVLTQSGKVYQVVDSKDNFMLDTEIELKQLSKYNIVEMTMDLNPEEYAVQPYFLTSEGRIVDWDGKVVM